MPVSSHCQSNPLRAAYYADGACQRRVSVIENVRLAEGTYRARFECPEIARQIVPGQFLMVRLFGETDPLLGRPLALYDVVLDAAGAPWAIDVVYLVMGKMTGRLAQCGPGTELVVWGPLGNGFPRLSFDHLVMVAGGIGQTPFLALGQEYLGRRSYGSPPRVATSLSQVTLCYGVRTAALAAGVNDFRAAGFDVRLSSDDGSLGHHGLVTDLLGDALDETIGKDRLVVCCGPEPMMEAVAKICRAAGAPCLVSLETPMACGIGICFSCVAKIRQPDGSWDYKRTCVEGPIFDAEKIEW
ncbi:MAG TPA: dihydroorotate dehydrogenase electron transfer subunit [Lacipirellulaceae bacterium]|jgi:dihydroorotate dehydrogenase electron transfer subunit